MSSGTESGIFWNSEGESNRDLFSLELKLDEKYEAGGATGGKMWADGAVEGKIGADGAAAEQANGESPREIGRGGQGSPQGSPRGSLTREEAKTPLPPLTPLPGVPNRLKTVPFLDPDII